MNFDAIGTTWHITPVIPGDLKRYIVERIEEYDRAYSRFREDSIVTSISRNGGSHELPSDAFELIDFYKKLYDVTAGKVTPLIGAVMAEAGYDAQYSFVEGELRNPPSWSETIEYTFPDIYVKYPVLLDFGAAGKGYLVDIISAILQESGYPHFTINAGGDIRVGASEAKIYLEDPFDKTIAIGQLTIQNSALCGSGTTRRKWGRFHHVIDPDLLESPVGVEAVWVTAKTCMLADGLATALFFVEPEILREHFAFEYAIIKDGNIKYSQLFAVEWFKES